MNKLVKMMSLKQNKNLKLNAGQYREVLKHLFSVAEVDLLPEEKTILKQIIGGL